MFKSALLRKSFNCSPLSLLNNHTEIQQTQPTLYDTLVKALNPEEQSILQGAIHQADAIESQAILAAQQAQAQQSAAGVNGNPSQWVAPVLLR